ncbi:MAG: type I pullulanase [Lachnospiraceae bacterium]|nr:type I pullulanase [Lachnospiraceae bacterium]
MQKRNIIISLLAVMLLLPSLIFFQPISECYAKEQIQVNLHYHRYNEDYDGWNIWSWIAGKEGASYEFTEEDEFGKIAAFSMEMEEDTKEIGFLVRQSTPSNAWEQKDCGEDRFIDLSYVKEGVIDIYVVEGETKFGYGEDEMNMGPKIMEASFMDVQTIKFMVSEAFDSAAQDTVKKLSVTDSKGREYPVEKLTSDSDRAAVITMKESLPLQENYSLKLEGYGELAISSNHLFSTKEFEEAYYYDGDDLGAVWTKEKTTFRLWAPTATEVLLNLYETGNGNDRIESIPMNPDVKGTWYLEKTGDLNGVYYTYSVTVDENTVEAVDVYAKAAGANGIRAMVVDLDSTDPKGFTGDEKPKFVNPTDAIIYELHIRDFSVDKSAGIKNQGKYLAFTEKGTVAPSGVKTGLDHLVDLGITHVHLLPFFDFASIDETTLMNKKFNWGYDPENYNVPEGSYSTDPHHGEVRIKEFKQMVQALHENGIRVVMDVVYNHTAASADSNFNKIVPGYYYRMTENGQFSNASGCGNETASERAMVRKFIVDSVTYWAKEYHVDGFRFDLMGIHDIETMNAVRKALNEIDPTIIIYGEGWTAGESPLPDGEQALKANMKALDTGIAAFSDDIRDGIKGSVFEAKESGFISGREGIEETIKFGIVASTKHSQINYSKINYSKAPWAAEPTQTITYTSAHDNLTLWDKLALSCPKDSEEDRIKMNMLSGAIVLTSQGTPFFQAGEEFLRSKPLDETGTAFDENSYQSPDSINSLKWNRKAEYQEVYDYYKGLITFRKEHSALRMTKASDIQENLTFLSGLDSNVVGYTIEYSPNGENAEALCIIFNANKAEAAVKIPEGNWNVYVKGNQAGTQILDMVSGGEVTLEPISAMVLVKEEKERETLSTAEIDVDRKENGTETGKEGKSSSNKMFTGIILLASVILSVIGILCIITKYKKE